MILAIPRLSPVPREAVAVDRALETALALLPSCTATAVPDAALFGVTEAADFAGRVEEQSRVADFLQLVAAGRSTGPGARQRPERGPPLRRLLPKRLPAG